MSTPRNLREKANERRKRYAAERRYELLAKPSKIPATQQLAALKATREPIAVPRASKPIPCFMCLGSGYRFVRMHIGRACTCPGCRCPMGCPAPTPTDSDSRGSPQESEARGRESRSSPAREEAP